MLTNPALALSQACFISCALLDTPAATIVCGPYAEQAAPFDGPGFYYINSESPDAGTYDTFDDAIACALHSADMHSFAYTFIYTPNDTRAQLIVISRHPHTIGA